jgi:hypothetical protein
MAEKSLASKLTLIVLVAAAVGVLVAFVGNSFGVSSAVIGGVTGGVIAGGIVYFGRRQAAHRGPGTDA